MRTQIKLLRLLPIAFFFNSCSNPDTSKIIIGKWEFLKFYADEPLSQEMKKDLNEFERLNKGLTIRFSPKGQFESGQPGGSKENLRVNKE